MAFARLHLTDYDRLVRSYPESTEDWNWTSPVSRDTAFERMVFNVKLMKREGAVTDGDFPINMVSGYEVTPEEKEERPELKNPKDLVAGGRLDNVKLLLWGSPNGNPSSNSAEKHGDKTATGSTYKTNAFESMAWLCSGTIIMSFTDK